MRALDEDEYSDSEQDVVAGVEEIPDHTATILDLYLGNLVASDKVLEVGCGSGDLFGRYGITHGVEPNPRRFAEATKKGAGCVAVARGVSECLPYGDGEFAALIMLNGFFQVRSELESLIEFNRVLRIGGRLILNLLTDDRVDVVCGRVVGWRNEVRLAGQFGLGLLAAHTHDAGPRFPDGSQQETTVLVFEKVRHFDPRYLRLPQVVGDPTAVIRNYVPERDWRLI
jgi:SAM-dependent methyltransferase